MRKMNKQQETEEKERNTSKIIIFITIILGLTLLVGWVIGKLLSGGF